MASVVPAPSEKDISRIVLAVRQLFEGRSNAVGTFTLDPFAAFTVVEFINCSPGCGIYWSPQTSEAATIATTMYCPPSGVIKGQFTIIHANVAGAFTDMVFSFHVQGGD